MRNPATSAPEAQGPTATTPRFEDARRHYLAARHELTAAALDELILRVRTRHRDAAGMLLICDDVEDGLYLAEVTDEAGRRLHTGGSLLDDRTAAQVVANLHGPDLAVLAGVHHDGAAMTFEVVFEERAAATGRHDAAR